MCVPSKFSLVNEFHFQSIVDQKHLKSQEKLEWKKRKAAASCITEKRLLPLRYIELFNINVKNANIAVQNGQRIWTDGSQGGGACTNVCMDQSKIFFSSWEGQRTQLLYIHILISWSFQCGSLSPNLDTFI